MEEKRGAGLNIVEQEEAVMIAIAVPNNSYEELRKYEGGWGTYRE